jgi:single-strand selective monofunctional uracil DNA glycosylase
VTRALLEITRKLSDDVDQIDASSFAAYTYNPLSYAREIHERYLRKFGKGKKEAVWLGMNPGPFGMAQTGVPFGDVAMVRDYLGLRGRVTRPEREHPKRPVQGLDCPKSEVSGTRLWGLARKHYPAPEEFFERFFVVNYCPLVFMSETGSNLTPDKLPKSLLAEIEACCDAALAALVRELDPTWVIGVGAFAEKCARRALVGQEREIGTILHPSPASPAANRGWADAVEKQLKALGLALP